MKSLFHRVSKKYVQFALGIVLILMGIDLIICDHLYWWPPYIVEVINSDFFGSWALFTGIGLLYVALSTGKAVVANMVWLLSAIGFFSFEGFISVGHAFFSNVPGWIIAHSIMDLGFAIIILFLISKSNTQK